MFGSKNLGLQGSDFVQQHSKLASQINRHHCYLWRLQRRLGGNLTISQTGITAKPCWILAIFFFFFPWITAEPPDVEPCRIGLAQDGEILLLPFEVGIWKKTKKKNSWKPVALHHCLQKCLFNAGVGLLFKPYLEPSKVIISSHSLRQRQCDY